MNASDVDMNVDYSEFSAARGHGEESYSNSE
jgi:hypothetical protein